MKRGKVKAVLKIVTIVLVLLTLVSIILLIISPKNVIETTTEIISIVVGSMALAVAIMSQVSANKEERRLRSIIADLHDIIRNDKRDLKMDGEIQQKLDKLIDLEEEKKKN